jgi:mRNA interferase RelE/StbE
MAGYTFTIKRQAIKALQRMPRQQAQRIRRDMDKLSEDPDRRDIDIAPLRGRPGFRLRVGDFRVIFERDDEAHVIGILRIAPRGQVY